MGEEFEAAAAICGDNYWWNNNINNHTSTRSNSYSYSMFPVMMGMGSTCSDAAGNYTTWQTDFMASTTSWSCSSSDDTCVNNFATSLPVMDAHNNNNNNNIKVPQSESATSDGSILQMMGFALSSSPSSDWNHNHNNNHSLFGCDNGRAENKFDEEARGSIDSIPNMVLSSSAEQVSSVDANNNLKAIIMMKQKQQEQQQQELFGIDQQRLNSVTSSTSIPSASYGGDYPSTLMQGLYHNNNNNNNNSLMKPPKSKSSAGGLHFSNNTPFWNASADALNDITPALVFSSSSSQYQLPTTTTTTFHDKPNCPPTAPLNNNKLKREEESPDKVLKRPRIETPSPLPTFKVRKEKLGDRITALQQLVSPFGKTDTASVLHEAIEYIKFLHDQVNVLSTPYMKNGTPIPLQQGCEKECSWSVSQDLRSRGLCLVPISSTFPMATETTADFWTPTFGGATTR